jgi:hypothetical protein
MEGVKLLEAQEGATRNDPDVCWTLLPCDIGGCSLLLLARWPHAYCSIKRRHTLLSNDKDLLDWIAKLQGEVVRGLGRRDAGDDPARYWVSSDVDDAEVQPDARADVDGGAHAPGDHNPEEHQHSR